MATRRPHFPIPLLIIIVVLLVLGFAANYYIQATATPEQLAKNVLLSAIPFILIFVAIVLAYIGFIVFMSSLLSGRIAPRPHQVIEIAAIVGIFAGILGIFQQWILTLFWVGFVVLLLSTLFFILWSHISPKRVVLQEE
jgi:hypothetical protein